MKQLAALLIILSLLTQTFNKVFIIADYYANTSKYAEHCENKDKPMMHCNGKCQIMKKLKAEDKKDQESPERKSDNKNDIILSSKSFFAKVPSQWAVLSKSEKLLPSSDGKSVDRSFDIFHPPQALSLRHKS